MGCFPYLLLPKMAMKILIYITICLFIGISNTIAQRHFITNQYVYDRFLMNPADAGGNSDCITINGFFQKQWFGTDLAPTTQLLSFQTQLTQGLGSGTYIYNDRNGHNKKLSLQQSFSTGVTLRENRRGFTTLSFGLSALLEQASLDQTSFNAPGGIPDPSISGGVDRGFGFNLNSGVILRINKFNTGISATNILPHNNPMYNSEWEPDLPMDLHFFASTSWKVADRDLYLEPIAYFRFNAQNDRRMDLNLKMYMPTPTPDIAIWSILMYRRTMDHQFGKDLGFATTLGMDYRSLSIGLEHQLGMTGAQRHYGSAMLLVAGYRFCTDRSKRAIPCSEASNGLGESSVAPKTRKSLFRR